MTGQQSKKAAALRRAFRILKFVFGRAAAYDSACFTRSGENGTRRMRTPVASKIALAIAAATGRMLGSPAPDGSISGWLISTKSIFSGVSVMSRIGIGQHPVDAGDALVVELHLLPTACGKCPARYCPRCDLLQAIGIDDQAAVVRHREPLRPDFPGAAIDVHFRDHRNPRPVAAASRRCRCARSPCRRSGPSAAATASCVSQHELWPRRP